MTEKKVEIDSAVIASAVEDINTDNDGNVKIVLADGRTFDLGSLKGEDGKDGVDGKNGLDGKAGFDGHNGSDGKNGTDGKDGADGKNGLDGKDGVDGKNGTNGKDGVSIIDVVINSDKHLIISLSDGTTKDAGSLDFAAVNPDKPDIPDQPDDTEKVEGMAVYDNANMVLGLTNKDSATYVCLKDGTDSMRPFAFAGASKLQKVELPSTMKFISAGGFTGAYLSEINIPENIQVTGAWRIFRNEDYIHRFIINKFRNNK